MSEPAYLSGDPASNSTAYDSEWAVECECGWEGDVPCNKEYQNPEVIVWGDWKCPNCDEAHSIDDWYDPNDDN
jgi:hypothetical protein